MVTRPDGCGMCGPFVSKQFGFCGCVGSGVGRHPGGGEAALIAPRVLNSTPADAVVSFEATVLLVNTVLNESCKDTPPPSHPATLFAMMLLVTVMPYQFCGVLGKPRHFATVRLPQAQTAAAAVLGAVAENQVRIDHQ